MHRPERGGVHRMARAQRTVRHPLVAAGHLDGAAHPGTASAACLAFFLWTVKAPEGGDEPAYCLLTETKHATQPCWH